MFDSDGVRDYTTGIIVYVWQCELGEAPAAATSTLSTRCPQGKHRKVKLLINASLTLKLTVNVNVTRATIQCGRGAG